MRPHLIQRLRARRRSAGVAIVTAIFLVVALAGLGVAVVTLSTSQQQASALDLQGQRAYQAAKAGIEWAVYIGLRNGAKVDAATQLGCTDAVASFTNTFAMPANTTLSQFTVSVQCWRREPGIASASSTTDPNDPTAGHFRIQSTACNQPGANGCPNPSPGPDYVQRVINAQL